MSDLKKHFLDVDLFEKDYILEILNKTSKLKISNRKENFNKNICALFYEDSTRTKLSFEKASNNLGLKFHNLDGSKSSKNKGESFYNTLKTIDSIGMDLIIIRHPSSGASHFAAKHVTSSVLNAGDGSHAHPTQTIADLFTIYEKNKNFDNLEISIVGDFIFSRVARSNIIGFIKMGCNVNILGPKELISDEILQAYEFLNKKNSGKIKIYDELEKPILNSDIIMPLRIQKERFNNNFDVDFEKYQNNWKIDEDLIEKCKKNVLIMHPGPVNEEIEISHKLVHSDKSLINNQVKNGVYVRQIIIESLLGK
ncbi:MAG: aspartate carbamoyltransferase catalytic subunit [Dehalococcoidales bacterium]|nr:aspartate carbamoyltransferase catalytic subunit [Dehalococcoidales bacterium]